MTNLEKTFKNAVRVALLIGLTACGASDPSRNTTSSAPSASPEPNVRHWKQSRIVTQQEAICNRVCRRLTECSVQYAETHLSPAVASQMSMPAGRAQQLNECHETRSECQIDEPTQSGVNEAGQCLRENQECSSLIACLD